MKQATEVLELSYAAQDVKQYDYDHWLTALFVPQEKRERFFTLLAFNSEISRIRETVSEPMLGDIRLQWWREALEGLEKKTVKTHPVIQALDAANKENALDISLMLNMVDMRSKDLDRAPIEDDEDLLAYADGTGGALHRLLLSALGGNTHSEVVEAANRAGRVYALIGILRAIRFHAGHDLVLLPGKRLVKADMTRDTIFQKENRTSFLKIVADISEIVRGELSEAKRAARMVKGDARSCVSVNTLSSLYLKRLKSAHFDPEHVKLTVGSQRKVIALLFQHLRLV